MLETFIQSDIFQSLKEATIIGREVPFAIPWSTSESRHAVMEGVIDLVYRVNGDVWIADYKTDRITADQMGDRAVEYQLQAQIYTEAVFKCLGLRPKGFQFIFLRTGTVVPVLS
jgi:ATP-dependent helicase/nuclease subunit A